MEFDINAIHPNGAIEPEEDHRDYQWDMDEIPQAGAPFDWNVGYDVEKEIGMTLTVKNQGASGSCGGQGMSAYGQALSKAHKGDGRERSAKFPYSQVFVPGGGSDYRSLARLYINQGMALESDCCSYENSLPPSEGFMERPQDITKEARDNAMQDDMLMAYAFPSNNIDTVAQAISVSYGAALLIRGSNNGTWMSTYPKPTTYRPDGVSNSIWQHYIYAGKVAMRNGKKCIGVMNSWGEKVGENGWQWLDEDYFTSGDVFGALVFIFSPKPASIDKYTFNSDLKEGDTGPDVKALQEYLVYDGELNVAPTGFYGPITCMAVEKFQNKYQLATPDEIELLQGTRVGPKTREKLNNML